MAKQKEHKLTYKFISALQNLLKSEDWAQHHRAKIVELQNSLEKSPEELADARVAGIQAKGKKFDEKNYPKMIVSFERAQESTRAEIAKLEQNLAQGVYTIGVSPFDSVEDARQMLSFAHILEVDTGSYNQDAVNALRNMLQANFSDLCTVDVVGKMFDEFGGRAIPEKEEVVLNKVLQGESLVVEDLLWYPDWVTAQELTHYQNIIANNEFIDREEFIKIAEELTLLEKFFYEGKFSVALYSMIVAQYFHSLENFKSFCENFVEISTFEDFEKIIPIEDMVNLSSISLEEQDAWHQIITSNGPKALKAFIKISNLGNTGISALDAIAGRSAEEAFAVIDAELKAVKFSREVEYPEFAELCRKYDVPEAKFEQFLEQVIPHQKNSDSLPDIRFEFQSGRHTYNFEKLEPGSIEGLFLGKMTNCCQFIGGAGEKYAVRGFVKSDSGFYVIRDEEGKIKGQSYAWPSNYNGVPIMVLDSFEFMSELEDIALPVIKKYQALLAEQEGLPLVIGFGGRTPKTDAIFLDGRMEKEAPMSSCQEFNDSEESTFGDSSSVYVITQDTKLKTTDPLPVFQSYDELIRMNSRVSFAKFVEQNPEKYSEFSTQQGFELICYSNIMQLFLAENIMDVDSVVNLFTKYEFSGDRGAYNYRNHKVAAYQACKQKIAECKEQGITDPGEMIDYILPVIPVQIGQSVEEMPDPFEHVFGVKMLAGVDDADQAAPELTGDIIPLVNAEDYSA